MWYIRNDNASSFSLTFEENNSEIFKNIVQFSKTLLIKTTCTVLATNWKTKDYIKTNDFFCQIWKYQPYANKCYL